MTDITAKPFDWNDNLSKEALEDFEDIRKDLRYCACQSIGMALAKLELLEEQGQELKIGRWIDITNKNGTVIAVKCSCCKNYPKHAIKSIFCPNCGCRMQEE